MTDRPMPKLLDVSREYWEGANRGQLRIQQCQAPDCGRYVFYPRVCCPVCGGGELAWRDARGQGRIVSYTRVHRPQHATFQAEAPIYFIAVALDEGPVLYSRLAQRPAPEEELMGRAVQVVFGGAVQGQSLPLFELTDARPVGV